MESAFTVGLRLEDGYRFSVDFGSDFGTVLELDEPEPLGGGTGPNAARVLGAAVGNCLAASLLYCLNRARVPVDGLTAEVAGELVRNEAGRVRIGGLRVKLRPGGIREEDLPRLNRCLGVFEDFCVVTQSVRNGLDVKVDVETGLPAVAGA